MDKLALKGIAAYLREKLGNDEWGFEWFSRLLAVRYMAANGTLDSDIFYDNISDSDAEKKCSRLFIRLSELFPDIFGYSTHLSAVPCGLSGITGHLGKTLTDDMLKNNVQIIGWLYQFYIAEPKARGTLKRTGRIAPDRIPAATQIFTPDWIVRYMTENTLGRLWMECGNGKCPSHWEYISDIDHVSKRKLSPESITFIDPCMGCGNILVYAFDIFMDIYRLCGYSDDEAAALILTKNIYGLDIDRRAYTLAYFSLIMKAAEYSPSVMDKHIPLNIAEFRTLSEKMKNSGDHEMRCCHIYGSLLNTDKISGNEKIIDILSRKYDAVVTNPPYMSLSSMDKTLLAYIRKNYADYSADLFSAFICRCGRFTKKDGYSGFLTPYVWMFIQSYEKMRRYIFSEYTIETLVQFEYSSFRDATVPVCMFTMKKDGLARKGKYIRLSEFKGDMEVQRQKTLEAIHNTNCGYVFEAGPELFLKIPDAPAAYWLSGKTADLYSKYRCLGSYVSPRKGCSTSDNDRFLRRWYEVDRNKLNTGCSCLEREATLKKYWFPYNKGGGYRKWYGFNSYVINWYNDGADIKAIPSAVVANYKYFMKPGLTWSTLTSGSFSIRSFGEGYIFDNGGCCIFDLAEKKDYICALLNSKVFSHIFVQLNPTLNFQSGDVAKFPVVYAPSEEVDRLAEECIAISKEEYDCYETSRDFKKHPLL